MKPSAWIYIITNKHNTVLYVGITNDLPTRVWEHRTKQDPKSFSAKYNLYKLVYYEPFELITEAIKREKYVKRKNRKWKNALIATINPEWNELRGDGSEGLYLLSNTVILSCNCQRQLHAKDPHRVRDVL